MDSTVFYSLLETPHKADLLGDELHQLVEDYPWFTQGRMLYSKSLQLNNDSDFDEQLHKTSVYTPNREVLYNLIVTQPDVEIKTEDQNNIFSVNTKEIEPIEKEKSTQLPPEKAWEDLKEEKIVFRLINEDQSKKKEIIGGKISSTTHQEKTEIADFERPKPTDKKTVEEEITENESKKPRVLDTLEKEIIVGAVSRVIEKEVEEELPDPVSVEEQQTDLNPSEKPEEENNFSSFTAMILKRAKEVHYIDKKGENSLNQVDFSNRKDASSTDAALKEKKKRLLDKFIALSPQITRGKLDEYEPVNLGQESLQESDFFITETMARIYAQQGKIGKAKKTYKLLSLKYPEKSVYFAARIKNLDKK